MIQIIKKRAIDFSDKVQKNTNSIGLDKMSKTEIQTLGLGYSGTMDLFNQRGKQTQSGLFVIDWGDKSAEQDN